jgi:hypothetical protein
MRVNGLLRTMDPSDSRLCNEAESDSLALRLAGSHFEASPYGLLRTALDSHMSHG